MSPTRRDRRGRGPRGPLAHPPVPAMRTRREAFDDLVLDAATALRPLLGQRYAAVDFAVEDVPPSPPAAWEEPREPLGRLFPAQGTLPARIVVYRRPVESTALDRAEMADIIREVLTEQVAALLGVHPDDLEP